MAEGNHRSPGLLGLTQRLVSTGLGALQNRGELLTVEWQEERARLTQVLLAAVSFAFLAILGVVLFTTTIVLLFPVEQRVYVMAGFTVLYLIGAVVAWLVLRSLLRRAPFAESLDQMQKDLVWLETFQ